MSPVKCRVCLAYSDQPLHVCGVLAHGAQVVEDADGCHLLHDLLLVVAEDGKGKPEENLAPLIQERVPDTQHCLQNKHINTSVPHKPLC